MITIVPYNPAWPAEFRAIAAGLRQALGYRPQAIGKPLWIGFPRAGDRPVPLVIFVVTGIPAGVNPPDVEVNAPLFETLNGG